MSGIQGRATERPGLQLRRQTMSGQVADDLRRRIMRGELPEGLQLKQEQLASEFGISKVPVREALHQLEAEGFVIQQFHRGAVVAGLSPGKMIELFELRAELEPWLLSLAVPLATEENASEAEQVLAEAEQSDDPAEWPALNRRFHAALYRPAGKDYTLDLVCKLHDQLDRYVRLQYALVNRKEEAMSEHLALLDMFKAKAPAAKAMLRLHILKAASDLKEVLAKRMAPPV